MLYSTILILASFISLYSESDENKTNTWHHFHDSPNISKYTKHKNEEKLFITLKIKSVKLTYLNLKSFTVF